MKAEGFAAVVETSPGNLQAWLKRSETLHEAASTKAAKLLAERYGSDLHRADLAWARHAAGMGLGGARNSRRQREYAERTAAKAMKQAD
jgi:hypothetical protein